MEDVTGTQGDSEPTPGAEPTELLVAAAKRRDPRALEELIAAHLDDLRAYVRLHMDPRLRARESSSDVVQSACREVLEDLADFEYRGQGAFRAWLFAIALNKVRQKRAFHGARKRDLARDRHAGGPEDGAGSMPPGLYASLCSLGPSPSQGAVAREEAQRIERAMDKLPEDHRQALVLARLVGLSRREMAERMGRSEAAVRTLLTRAGIRLLAALEERI